MKKLESSLFYRRVFFIVVIFLITSLLVIQIFSVDYGFNQTLAYAATANIPPLGYFDGLRSDGAEY